MVTLIEIVFLLALVAAANFPGRPPPDRDIRAELEANIGPHGARSSAFRKSYKIQPGAVIAASEGPYLYTWTRDAALVMEYLVDKLSTGTQDVMGFFAHQQIIHEYRQLQPRLMNLTIDLSDIRPYHVFTFKAGDGLGEPKFNLDGSFVHEEWGRPQGDGPALRAHTLLRYTEWLVDNGHGHEAKAFYWPIIRNDLDYVAQYWTAATFDLWEEVEGESFYTRMVQYKSLIKGLNVGDRLGLKSQTNRKSMKQWAEVAPHVKCSLDDFWNAEYHHIKANLYKNGPKRTGIASDTFLASVHTWDPNLGCDFSTFQPCSDRALRNFKRIEDNYRNVRWSKFSLNKNIAIPEPVHLGRYPEDAYGGPDLNGIAAPWYLLTLGAGEFLYDVAYTWERQGSFEVTDESLNFFRDHSKTIIPGIYGRDSVYFSHMVDEIRSKAHKYVMLANSMIPDDGQMSEQYDRDTGRPSSVKHLTWSYAAYGTAYDRAMGIFPHSWVTGGLGEKVHSTNLASGQCERKNFKGEYTWKHEEHLFGLLAGDSTTPSVFDDEAIAALPPKGYTGKIPKYGSFKSQADASPKHGQ